MFERVAIVGDGQMGLVLADLLAARGLHPHLWGPFPEPVEALRRTRRSPRLDLELPASVAVIADPAEAIGGADLLVNAIPVQFMRPVWSQLLSNVNFGLFAPPRAIVSVSKGFEVGSWRRPSEILQEVWIGDQIAAPPPGLAVLSGPTIAAELARRQPATMVAASVDPALATAVQETFGTPWMRIYASPDPLGVEVAGAVKNVIALAAGIVDGLGIGFNAKSALLARGLAEIVRLGMALGARPETFFGIAGVGDLATTCFSPEGRNRCCGEAVGRGGTLAEHLAGATSVVEGVETTRAVVELAAAQGIEMPIAAAVHAVLFDGVSPAEALAQLMNRERGVERIG
jgi:glycerol-3-phosphate dehydrogenase (NAD(P)+)